MRSLLRFAVLLGASLSLLADPPAKEKGTANRLAKESSPYLLQHAYNPVDWFPWGPEAFAKAAAEKKLIFLSIGYSSCHWCHVMERESFANAEIAKLMNEKFICIKVDREERPDVDELYMTALQVMNGSGGWPLSMFLMPDGKPIVGGTYFPPFDKEVDGEKLNGFKSILGLMAKLHAEKGKELAEQADSVAQAVTESLAKAAKNTKKVPLSADLPRKARAVMSERLDPVHGGFGSPLREFRGTKFPMVSALLLIQAEPGDAEKLLTLTLDKMAAGGIYDHLGGGFHRYSVERTWTVPHFEKMLYDNAQLVEVYAEAVRRKSNTTYERVIRETLAFVERELKSPEGGFYAALDADSEGEEGRFYVWTTDELLKALPDEKQRRLLTSVYGGADKPNFEDKYHILTERMPLDTAAKTIGLALTEAATLLADAKKKLFEVRAKRPRPFLDTKILTAWNGQMIAAFAKAGSVLKEPAYLKTAGVAADFLLAKLRSPEGRLLRTFSRKSDGSTEAKLNGYLDDYAFLLHGLLSLYEATEDQARLTQAVALAEQMCRLFGDKDGGFFYTSHDHEKLFARSKDHYDGAQPAGNSVACRALIRLAILTGDKKYRTIAEQALMAFAEHLTEAPGSAPLLNLAVEELLRTDRPLQPKKEAEEDEEEPGIPSSAKKVKVTVDASPAKDGKRSLTIKLAVAKGWHIYGNPVGSKILDGADTRVTVKAGMKKLTAQVTYPQGMWKKDKIVGDHTIYEGEITITAVVEVPADVTGPLTVEVGVQACSGNLCCLYDIVRKEVR